VYGMVGRKWTRTMEKEAETGGTENCHVLRWGGGEPQLKREEEEKRVRDGVGGTRKLKGRSFGWGQTYLWG